LNFLYLFLQVLIEAGGRYELTTVDEKALYAALERVYKLPAEIRTLTNFASILDPLGERLHRWTQAGVYPLAWGFSVVQRFGKSAKGHMKSLSRLLAIPNVTIALNFSAVTVSTG